MPPKVVRHFKKVDPILYAVIKRIEGVDAPLSTRGQDYFVNLIDSIVSQQLSGKAAFKIFGLE